MKSFTKILLAAGALAFGAISHATPVVNWDVTATGTWTYKAPGSVLISADKQTLSWGSGSAKSSLVITNPETTNIPTWYGGGVPPAGYTAPSIALTHNNKVINGASLTGATLSVAMTLKPTSPVGDPLVLPTIGYKIKFVETPNSGTCAVEESPAKNKCNDIFVLLEGLFNEPLTYDGQEYFVNAFTTTGGVLGALSNSACAAAGQANGCIGFTTVEKMATTLAFGLTISSKRLEQQVPEPGSLALIGLALAGLGFASRRRRSAV